MSLDVALTYAIDWTMALGVGYIGTSFVLYMARRWPELGKTKAQPVNIPLSLKPSEAVPLELEQSEKSVLTLPEPMIPAVPQPPEIATAEPVRSEDVPEIPVLHQPNAAQISESGVDKPVAAEWAESTKSITDDAIVADLFPQLSLPSEDAETPELAAPQEKPELD